MVTFIDIYCIYYVLFESIIKEIETESAMLDMSAEDISELVNSNHEF